MAKQVFSHISDYRGLPLLIVDKSGVLGKELYLRVKEDARVVYVGHTSPTKDREQDTFFVPFRRLVPNIPDVTYKCILVFYNGEAPVIKALSSFAKKAQKDQCKLIVVLPLHHITHEVLRRLSLLPQHVYIVLVGDVFGEQIPLASHVTIHRYFHEAIKTGRITIQGDGLRKTYPVLSKDVSEALVGLMVSTKEPGMYFLFPQHPLTELALAHEFQKIDPLLRLDFTRKRHTVQEIVIPQEGTYLLPEHYPIKSKIKETHLLELTQVVMTSDAVHHKQHTSFFKGMLLGIIFCLLFPIILLLTSTVVGVGAMQGAKRSIETANIQQAVTYAVIARYAFTVSQTTLDFVGVEAMLIGKDDALTPWENRISAARELSFGLHSLLNSVSLIQRVYEGKSMTPKDDVHKTVNEGKEFLVLYKKIQLEQKDFFTNSMVAINGDAIDPLVSFFINTADVLPHLLGVNEKKTYLVLFQNNMELRPGGGFIGSYGLVTFDKGRLVDFTVHDVYDADGQLKGHIEPPFAVRRHMPHQHLYLRDSNFHPDFTKSASMSAYLFHEETGTQVDGVIAIDVTFVKAMVGAFDGIWLPDYKETVTEENFYLLTQTHVEKNFFPGSTQKKEFLRSLYQAMREQLLYKGNVSSLRLAQAISEGIAKKHILFAFSDESVQRLFLINGYSSSLWDDRSEDSGTVNNTLGISEANIGGNKANYYIKRKVEQHVTIKEDGTTETRAVVRYINESTKWPGGDYTTYTRFIIPAGSKVLTLHIDGKEEAIVPAVTDPSVYETKTFTPPKGVEVEEVVDDGKAFIGLLLAVPQGGTKVVSLTYRHPKLLAQDLPAITYDTKVIKQPGTEDDPFLFTLTYPTTYSVAKSSPSMKTSSAGVSYENILTNDLHLHVLFSRKY